MDDGNIEISIHRKKTHTDRYLHYTSHHPIHHKAGVVETLHHRVNTLLTNAEHQNKERQHINEALRRNGYPQSFLKKHTKVKQQEQRTNDNDVEWKGFATLPYVSGVTERIERVLRSNSIRTVVKPLSTLRKSLSRPKDVIPKEKKTGVVYGIPCADCDLVYIGETKRALSTRVKEHKTSVRLAKLENSALAEHCHKENHSVAWDDVSILANEQRWHQRKWTEACLISKNKNSIFNRDNGRVLPECYAPIIKS